MIPSFYPWKISFFSYNKDKKKVDFIRLIISF